MPLRSLIPGFISDPRQGPLPALLVLLTMSTGLVDAVTFLRLGHVFVANMTGNVVFTAFALGGATEFSVPLSLTALAVFLIGALAGGRLHKRFGSHRGRHLTIVCRLEVLLVTAAFAVSLWADARGLDPIGAPAGYAMIALLAMAMGLQNATIRSIGVPGLTTTVLTMTLTGIAADWRLGTPEGAHLRPLGVIVLFAGAGIGAILVLNRGITSALAFALLLLGITAVAANRVSRGTPAWAAP